MVIQQLIKVLNSTEAGRTKTNDSYLRMSKGVFIDNFFSNEEKKFYNFKRKKDNSEIQIRVENCHDGIRVYNMGKITKSSIDDLWAGDRIILEKRILDSNIEFFIDSIKDDAIFFQNFKNKYFKLLTPLKLNKFLNIENLKIKIACKDRNRTDSDITDLYEIELNGKQIIPNLADAELLRIDIINNKAFINKTKSWEYYSFELGD